jgi:hypothetical protein
MRNEQINNTAPSVSVQTADDPFSAPGLDRRFSFYRAVNERIREVNAAFAVFADNFEVFCECGARNCLERVEVPAKVYEDVLSGPRSLVKAGHESPDHGVVVAESGSYLVIEETSPYAHGKQREDWFESSASYDPQREKPQ